MVSNHPEIKTNTNVPPMPHHMRILMEQERVFVFSVNPKEFSRPQGTSGNFTVPARREGERVSEPVRYQNKAGIPRIIAETVMDTLDGRTVTQKWDFSTDGVQLAKDICGLQYPLASHENMTRCGLFIAAGFEPTEQEIREAEKARDAEYMRLIKEADDYYRVNGGMETINGKTSSNISDQHIEAAVQMRVERPWIQQSVPLAMIECPACGVSCKPGVAFCPNGDIMDEEKARKARPWLFAEEKRGPGRPRSTEAA